MERDEEQPKQEKPAKKKKQKKRIMPSWLSWGLGVLFLSFALTVLFSFLTEISIKSIKGSPVLICVIVLIVLLILNIGCDLLANAILTCQPDAFHAMASNKIKGAKRAVMFCKNATKLGSIFADVIGDICGIVSGAAGAVLTVYIAAKTNGDIWEIIASIGVSAVIGALTVGGKAIFKHFAIKYNRQIVFSFAKFTTFFKKEK